MEEMDRYKEILKSVECPFNWNLDEIQDRLNAADLIEKLNEKEEEVSEPWVHVCVHFNIAYLQFENKKAIRSVQVFKDLDRLLKSSENELVKRYQQALRQIYYASRAVLALKTSTLSEVKQYADQLTTDLTSIQLSAIYAIKANIFLEYGVNGSHRAMDFAKEALKLNPEEADWHFLAGKLYSRLRHFSREHMPSPDEIRHLDISYRFTRSARAAIFLANTYLEKCKSVRFNAKKQGTLASARVEINAMSSEAKRLILYAIDKNDGQCVHINMRCAFGLSNLPFHERDLEKAKELLDDALDRSPLSPMGNKLAGDLCAREENPLYDKALKYYKIAASKHVFSAELAIFEINVKLGKTPDEEDFYSRLLDTYKEKNYQLQVLIHAAEYFIFIRRDIFMALTYFLKLIEMDPHYHALTSRYMKYIKCEVNMYAVISNETRIAEKNNLYTNEDQKNILKKALSEIRKHYPKIMEQLVEQNYVQQIIDNAAAEEKNKFNRGQGRGRRGRGGRDRGGRGRGGRGRGGNTAFSDRGNNISRESNFSGNGRGNLRGGGRNPSFDRRGGRNSSQDRQQPKSRGNSRERRYSGEDNYLVEQFKQLHIKTNSADKSTPSNAKENKSYEHKREENISNPLYIKYLESKYKNKNHDQTFREWLDMCSNFHHSPPYSIADKDYQVRNHDSHQLMEEIRQRIAGAHASKNKSRKTSESSRGMSPYRSSKRKQKRSPSPRLGYSDSNDSSSSAQSFSQHSQSRNVRRTSGSKYDQRSSSSSGRYSYRGRRVASSERRKSNSHRRSLSRSSSHKKKSKPREHHSRDAIKMKTSEGSKRRERVSSGERSKGMRKRESYEKPSNQHDNLRKPRSREHSSSIDRDSKRRSRDRYSDERRHYRTYSSSESSSEDYIDRDSRRMSSDQKSNRNKRDLKKSSSRARRSRSRDCYESDRRKSGSESSKRHKNDRVLDDERKETTSRGKSYDRDNQKWKEKYSDQSRHSSKSRDSSLRNYSQKESVKRPVSRTSSRNSHHRHARSHERESAGRHERHSDRSSENKNEKNRKKSRKRDSSKQSSEGRKSIRHQSPDRRRSPSGDRDSKRGSSYDKKSSRHRSDNQRRSHSRGRSSRMSPHSKRRDSINECSYDQKSSQCRSSNRRSYSRDKDSRSESSHDRKSSRCRSSNRRSYSRDNDSRSESSHDRKSSRRRSSNRRSYSRDKDSRSVSSHDRKSSRCRSSNKSYSRHRDSRREGSFDKISSQRKSRDRRSHSKDRDFRRESSSGNKSSHHKSLEKRSDSTDRDSIMENKKNKGYKRTDSRQCSPISSHRRDRMSPSEDNDKKSSMKQLPVRDELDCRNKPSRGHDEPNNSQREDSCRMSDPD